MTTKTWNDAGLLREYVAARFGQGFTYGQSLERHTRGLRSCRRLAKLTGFSMDSIIKTAKADAAILFA